MKINIIDIGAPDSFQPIVTTRSVGDCPVGGTTLEKALDTRIKNFIAHLKYDANNEFFNIS